MQHVPAGMPLDAELGLAPQQGATDDVEAGVQRTAAPAHSSAVAPQFRSPQGTGMNGAPLSPRSAFWGMWPHIVWCHSH